MAGTEHEELLDLYLALKVGNLGLKTPFTPKYEDTLKKAYEKHIRDETGRLGSGLFKQSQVLPAVQALGYTDAENAVTVDGFLASIYSKQQ